MYDRYCKLRDSMNLKDSDIAKQAKITPSTFSDWKKGKSAPNVAKMVAIARVLGTSVEYLVTGEGQASVDKTRTLMNEALLTRELLGDEEYNLVVEYRKMNRDKDALHAQNADEIRLLHEFRALDVPARNIILAALDMAFEESERGEKEANAKIA